MLQFTYILQNEQLFIHLQQYIYSSLEESKENSNNKPKEIEQERK